jgi:hypothetical protein
MIRNGWKNLIVVVALGSAVIFVASDAFTGGSRASSGSAQGSQSSVTAHRRMYKDDVKNLLGDPDRVSVSRFYESWTYGGGSVTFDGKGRLDYWSEP